MRDLEKVKLGEVLSVKHGYAFPGAGFSDDTSFPVLTTPGNFSVGGGFRKAKTKTFNGDYPAEYRLDVGDLIITMTDLSKEGDTLGLPATVPPGNVYLHNQRIGRVQILDQRRIDKSFLLYFLRTAEYRAHILGTASGSTVRHTSPSRIEAFETLIPSVRTQRAIAEVLGALDDKIAANTRLAHTADRLAGHLFDQAASSVPMIPMSQVLTPVLGGTPVRANTDLWNGEDLWASAKDITGAPFAVVTDTVEKITQLAVERTKAKPLPAGSVILTARGTVGAVARLAVPSSFNQSCYGFTPRELPPGLLYFSILRAAQHAKSLAHGSVFDTITMRTFDHLQIPDFGDEARSTEAGIAPLLDLVTANVFENGSLAKTRDVLLPQLMSGRLCVKDAEATVEPLV